MREPFPGLLDALERGTADLVVGPQLTAPGLIQRKVGEDGFASAVRRDHPRVGRQLDLDTFVSLRHLVIDPVGTGGVSAVDTALTERGRVRDVAMRIPHFVGAPFITARSDLLLTAPWALLNHAAQLLPLRLFEPPLELPVQRTFMTWHERATEDPAHAFLREVAARCTAAVLSRPSKRPKLGAALSVVDRRR
jgi:DNA-binding transcriptional LysR family regulator